MTVAPNLDGGVVALSTSPPADLGRLGFPEAEFGRVVFNLCMRIVRTRGRILYGGHLQEGSLTASMFEFVASAYVPNTLSNRGEIPRPFLHLLPLSEFKRTPFARVRDVQQRFGSFLETRVILNAREYASVSSRSGELLIRFGGAGGNEVKIAGPDEFTRFSSGLPLHDQQSALTAMRDAAQKLTGARVVLGGKRGDLGVPGDADRFFGVMPGIYEEALSSLRTKIPTVIFAAYGGAARDLAIDLGLLDRNLETPFLGEIQSGYFEARERMRLLRREIPELDRRALSEFAVREDCENLARDAIAWVDSHAN